MKVFIDTEYMEDGMNLDILSIGMVREDGKMFYAELSEVNKDWASEWVKENVLPTLTGDGKPTHEVTSEVLDFVGEDPEFWGCDVAYDWVALHQLYGARDYVNPGWPSYCRDVRQLAEDTGKKIDLPEASGTRNALKHALWVRDVYAKLTTA